MTIKMAVTFKHLEHTPALDDKIKQKTEKLEKYLHETTTIHWTCGIRDAHDGIHFADIHLSGPTFQYNASSESENLYKSIDLAVQKLEKQLLKRKEKLKDKIHQKKSMPTETPQSHHNDDGSDDL